MQCQRLTHSSMVAIACKKKQNNTTQHKTDFELNFQSAFRDRQNITLLWSKRQTKEQQQQSNNEQKRNKRTLNEHNEAHAFS